MPKSPLRLPLLPGSEIKQRSPAYPYRFRLLGVSLVLVILFALLLIQFFRIQILQHEKWKKYGLAQHTTVVKEPFKRGVFYSNTEIKKDHPKQRVSFVVDVPKFHLYIDPKNIPISHRSTIAEKLYQSLQIKEKHIQEEMRAQFDKPLRSRRLFAWISGEKKEEIEVWWASFAKKQKIARNALFFVKDYQRSYPFGKMLGQVLHAIRDEPTQEREKSIPTGGLEYVFDSLLKGKAGKRRFYRSPRHAMDEGELIEPSQDGADIYLTINHCLQAIVEEEIEEQVKRAESKRGWAIMMDPHTGHILALAQYPFFSPSDYRNYFNEPNKLAETQVKAAIDPYEPGSTMKIFTIALALMANEELKKRGKPPLFDPEAKEGTMPTFFSGRRKPIKDIRNHRYMNMYMAIQKSSNVYCAKMADRIISQLGEKWYRDQLEKIFGFGKITGVELPAESPGRVPQPGRLHPNGTLEWSKGTPYTLAMGHNILVNSFQMLKAFSMIINGGHEVTPTLVKKIVRKNNKEGKEEILVDHRETSSFVMNQKKNQKIDPIILPPLVQALRFVTKRGGAEKTADIVGYTEAGKTSTTEKVVGGVYSKKVHISTFIGVAPLENPAFVLLVAIDEPVYKYVPGLGGNQFGSVCAAPAFARIGKRALHYLGIEPDDPHSLEKNGKKKEKWASEVDALEKLYREWNQ